MTNQHLTTKEHTMTTTYTIEMKQDGKWVALRYTYDSVAEAQAEIDHQVLVADR